MLNVLVTGSNGQVGSEIKELSVDYAYNFYFTTSKELDITEYENVESFCTNNNINIIINTAAYTAVDKAESEQELAEKVNHLGVKNLATIAKKQTIKLIHISTDYVFDGKNHKPYTEEDITNPQSIYGKTKLDGEGAMLAINPKDSIIIRTSWVYSSFGANFVKTMLRLGKEKESLSVIYDQVGTPTYARDLAKAILDIVGQLDCRASLAATDDLDCCHASLAVTTPSSLRGAEQSQSNVQIYNYSNEGALSWYDFAKEIMRMAKLDCQINPIETVDYPTPAKRPHYSLLNKSKIKKEFNIVIPYWKDGLDDCLKRLGGRK